MQVSCICNPPPFSYSVNLDCSPENFIKKKKKTPDDSDVPNAEITV